MSATQSSRVWVSRLSWKIWGWEKHKPTKVILKVVWIDLGLLHGVLTHNVLIFKKKKKERKKERDEVNGQTPKKENKQLTIVPRDKGWFRTNTMVTYFFPGFGAAENTPNDNLSDPILIKERKKEKETGHTHMQM